MNREILIPEIVQHENISLNDRKQVLLQQLSSKEGLHITIQGYPIRYRTFTTRINKEERSIYVYGYLHDNVAVRVDAMYAEDGVSAYNLSKYLKDLPPQLHRKGLAGFGVSLLIQLLQSEGAQQLSGCIRMRNTKSLHSRFCTRDILQGGYYPTYARDASQNIGLNVEPFTYWELVSLIGDEYSRLDKPSNMYQALKNGKAWWPTT